MSNPNTAGMEDIRYCYRLLLGREPDAAGQSAFARLASEGAITPQKLAEHFLSSEEFLRISGSLPTEIPLDGYVINVRLSDAAIGRPLMAAREWEPNVASALVERLHAGACFLDVGANIGYFTAMAAQLVGETGRVIAVEPMDKNLQLIYATVARNGFKNVDVHPFAASDVSCTVQMSTGPGSSNGEIINKESRIRSPTFAQTRRLDELVSPDVLVDIVKFDIEGHELSAWKGAEHLLARSRPIVLTEFHPYCLRRNAGIDPIEYATVLFNYGVVTVRHFDGKRSGCADSEELMRLWEGEDSALRTNGKAHLDLLVEPFIQ